MRKRRENWQASVDPAARGYSEQTHEEIQSARSLPGARANIHWPVTAAWSSALSIQLFCLLSIGRRIEGLRFASNPGWACDKAAEELKGACHMLIQFGEGFSACSITTVSTGALPDFSLRPISPTEVMAVEMTSG